jgi:hypothetical protein
MRKLAVTQHKRLDSNQLIGGRAARQSWKRRPKENYRRARDGPLLLLYTDGRTKILQKCWRDELKRAENRPWRGISDGNRRALGTK